MSFVQEHVKTIDGHLDQLLLSRLGDHPHVDSDQHLTEHVDAAISTDTQAQHLEALNKSLSIISNSKITPSSRSTVYRSLRTFDSLTSSDLSTPPTDSDLEWILIAKITNQVYGHVLQALIDQTLPLNDDLWYYLEVLTSHRNTALYSIQTSPLRLYAWGKDVYAEVQTKGVNLSDGWQQFYGHVKAVIKQRSLADVRRRATAPLALVQSEVRKKIAALERAKRVNASAVGYLLSNGFNSESLGSEEEVLKLERQQSTRGQNDWKKAVIRSVSAMRGVFDVVCDGDVDKQDFESAVTASTSYESLESLLRRPTEDMQSSQARDLIDHLSTILNHQLPTFDQTSYAMLEQNSKPSRIVRYWLPATALLLSSSTILRIIANRRAEIAQWIRDLGSTVIDFWRNWVVEPTRKVIGTIRHDEASEVSIMSKRSLEGDRESLERMVVDFAIDNPEGGSLNDVQIADIRSKVQEGDLTPVLKAYERDLKSPLYGSVRGNLIRALLIQIQKTKVDVEVAMGGIDNLLKSQELVFGFVGLTPGILVCLGVFRWISSLSSSRSTKARGQKQSHSYQVLRNIDRILTASPQSDAGTLSFEEYGLLVCEAIVLREIAVKTFSKQALRNFVHDFNDLIDNHSGVGRQIRVADRIRWAYAQWL